MGLKAPDSLGRGHYSIGKIVDMSLFIYFSHTSPIKIWGLTSAERVERVLNGVTGKGRIEDLSSLQEADSVLILRGDYLFDDRLVKHLAATPNVIIRLEHERQQECAVAAHVPAHLARQALAVIEGSAPADTLPGVRIELPATISASFEQNLHKFEPPFVLPITAEKNRTWNDVFSTGRIKGSPTSLPNGPGPALPAGLSDTVSVLISDPIMLPCSVFSWPF